MSDNSSGRNAVAIGLISLGVLFLLAQVFQFSFLGLLWPLFIIGPGAVFLYFAINGNRDAAGLAVPGAVISGTGLILFYQNLTGHWNSWAYVWALYPVFVGLALVFIGRRTASESTLRTGDNMVKWGLFAFIGLWALFELLIFGGNSQLISTLLPLVLIGAGVYILMRGRSGIATRYEKPKSANGYRHSHSDSLQEKIDAALTEDDDEK
jgi:hypothetical protein